MKKLLIALMLTLISVGIVGCSNKDADENKRKAQLYDAMQKQKETQAPSGWTYIEENAEKDGYVYVDLSTIRRVGNMVKMWNLYDYKIVQEPTGDKYLSAALLYEYDCKEEQSRHRATAQYSGKKQTGQSVYTNNYIGEWSPLTPNSIGKDLWKIACGKK